MLSLDKQNAFREKYRQAHPGWRPATELFAALVRRQLRPSDRVLDIGCGRGGLVEQLQHPLPQVVGVDPDWHSLRAHRLPLPRAAAFSDALPFAPATFDLAYASWVLEHLPQPERTFASLRRAVRPGGTFLFITPNGRHPLAWLNQSLGRLGRVQARLVERLYGRAADDTFPTFYRANTEAHLQNLCQLNGWLLEELHPVPDPTYLAFTPRLFRLMSRFEDALPRARKLHLVGLARRV